MLKEKNRYDSLFICPKCSFEFEGSKWECPSCKVYLAFCDECFLHSEIQWQQKKESPGAFSLCTKCKKPIKETLYAQKSSLYEYFYYAFKFVNRIIIEYPRYFNRTHPRSEFPFGEIIYDLGDYINDFYYHQDGPFVTDWGSARAYKLNLEIDGENIDCIAISHESGIEIFLIAVGTFIGIETSKFILKRTLEKIEEKINTWWQKDKKKYSDDADENSLVLGIQIRTPNWEISIDGTFSPEERQELFNLIEKTIPPSDIDELTALIADKKLAKKVKEYARKIRKGEKKVKSIGNIHHYRKI